MDQHSNIPNLFLLQMSFATNSGSFTFKSGAHWVCYRYESEHLVEQTKISHNLNGSVKIYTCNTNKKLLKDWSFLVFAEASRTNVEYSWIVLFHHWLMNWRVSLLSRCRLVLSKIQTTFQKCACGWNFDCLRRKRPCRRKNCMLQRATRLYNWTLFVSRIAKSIFINLGTK